MHWPTPFITQTLAAARAALASAQAMGERVLSAGPVRCLRLALATVSGLLALACLPALVLAALLILVPLALAIVLLAGVALAAWPFSLPRFLFPDTPANPPPPSC